MFQSLWRVLPPFVAIALTACGGGSSYTDPGSSNSSSGNGSSSSSSSGAGNVVSVIVGPGPTSSSSFFNIPSTTVKVCLPGSATSCKTIANVLVDTGSYGLRLLASALNGLIKTADYQQDPSTGGNFIAECLPFADGFTWGPIASVDLYIGGEKAIALPVNVIDDTTGGTLEPAPPANCQTIGNHNNIGSATNLGANGILGVGLFSYDCGDYCAQPVSQQNATNGFLYYSCGATACNATSEPLTSQVINPVAMFPIDNNGVILHMDAVGAGGAPTASGKLIFGIGTQTNNGLGSATVLTTDMQGLITTIFNGQTLSASFFDSGSNGLYFPDSGISTCPASAGGSQFYCPTPSPLPLTATNQGQNGVSSQVSMQIVTLTTPGIDTQFAIDIGGPSAAISGSSAYFDFGVPFFYGRTVFTGMQTLPGTGTQTTPQAPYLAY